MAPLPFRFRYTGIRVEDRDESIRFYTEDLGMRLVERMKTAPTKGEVATLRSPGSEQELELNFYARDSPFWAPTRTVKISITSPSRWGILRRPWKACGGKA